MVRTQVTGPQILDGSVSLTADVAGVLPIPNGGTGQTTLAAAGILVSGGALGTPSSGTATNLTGFPTLNQNTTGTAAGLSGTPTITNATYTNYTESVVAIGSTGTAKTIDLTSGTVQTATLTGNCTFTMPTASAGKSFLLLLNTGAGSFTGTFTGVKWPAATAPTVTTTASRLDILTFISDGTNWYGSFVQNYTP